MPKYVKLPDDYGKTDIDNLLQYLCDSEVEIVEESDIISTIIDNRISSILNRIINDARMRSIHNIDEDLIPAYKKLIKRRTEEKDEFINFTEIDKIVIGCIDDVNCLVNGVDDEELLDYDEEDL